MDRLTSRIQIDGWLAQMLPTAFAYLVVYLCTLIAFLWLQGSEQTNSYR